MGTVLSFRNTFSELFPPVLPENEPKEAKAAERTLLVDCSGSTHNLFVDTKLGLIKIFDLFGSLATELARDLTEEGEGIDLVPFASRFSEYKKQQSESIQAVYKLAEEEGLFNELGEGTDLYEPLEKTFNNLIERAKEAKESKKPKIRSSIVVLTDGMPAGGLDSLAAIRDLCVRKFEQLQELGYNSTDLGLCFVTVHADGISADWEEQTLEKWQTVLQEADSFYQQLDQELSNHSRVEFDFVSHLRLTDVAKLGVSSFLAQIQKKPEEDEK